MEIVEVIAVHETEDRIVWAEIVDDCIPKFHNWVKSNLPEDFLEENADKNGTELYRLLRGDADRAKEIVKKMQNIITYLQTNLKEKSSFRFSSSKLESVLNSFKTSGKTSQVVCDENCDKQHHHQHTEQTQGPKEDIQKLFTDFEEENQQDDENALVKFHLAMKWNSEKHPEESKVDKSQYDGYEELACHKLKMELKSLEYTSNETYPWLGCKADAISKDRKTLIEFTTKTDCLKKEEDGKYSVVPKSALHNKILCNVFVVGAEEAKVILYEPEKNTFEEIGVEVKEEEWEELVEKLKKHYYCNYLPILVQSQPEFIKKRLG